MTTSKSIISFLIPTDLIQATARVNRSAAIESAVRLLQVEGVVAVVARALQTRLTKGERQEVSAKVTASIPSDTIRYLREVSQMTGLSINQVTTYALEAALFKER